MVLFAAAKSTEHPVIARSEATWQSPAIIHRYPAGQQTLYREVATAPLGPRKDTKFFEFCVLRRGTASALRCDKSQFGAQYRIFLIIHKNGSIVNCMFFSFCGKNVIAARQKAAKVTFFKKFFPKTLVKNKKSSYSLLANAFR